MKKLTLLLLVVILLVSQLQAELFTQLDTVNIVGYGTLNIGGIGNIIAGVDVDEDGKTEIYMVSDNTRDDALELVPRIYKYEKIGDTEWELVWQATPPVDLVEAQNTWPPLSLTDLDKDGKKELTWGIVNNITENVKNPARIIVYEHSEGDNFGVDNLGQWEPNSAWSISDQDDDNIRPINWEIHDIDEDGRDEIIFASRQGRNQVCIVSVDNIPDDGDGSETWTVEYSLSKGVGEYTGDNKWDVAVIGNNAYFFDEVEISKISWNGSAYIYTALAPLPGGISFDAVQVYDIDKDGKKEMITGEYRYGDDTRHIWLLEEEADTLKRTPLFDINTPELLNGGRLAGGATGDIDADGNIDFVFGTYYSGPPNGMIFRLEYQGGDIDNSSSWEFSVIDSAYAFVDLKEGGMWNVIEIANVDDDKGLEVLYTSSLSIPYSSEFPTAFVSAPVIILDSPNTDPITSVKDDVQTVEGYELSPAYPNPFNPSTKISFKIPVNEHVNLTVYNLQGQKIRTLTDSKMSAGVHSKIWNGINDNGIIVSTGVYLYQLTTPNFTEIRRMTFIK